MSTSSSTPSVFLTFTVFLFSIFLSASLLFMVQPMAGKMLLPLVGGAPSGWIVALAFFQLSLLVGYIAAHGLSKLTPQIHGFVVVALLALGAVFLPLGFNEDLQIENSSEAAFIVFFLLTTAVAVPFIALSSVSSTVQRLFHYARGTKGRDPYFLYAVSNFGSFAGLLGYPLLIEPFFTITAQTHYWMYAYGILIVGILIASLLSDRKREALPLEEDLGHEIVAPNVKSCLYWTALAFVPSSLMVGVTNFVTLEITPLPLFWVIPLALYLITYIVAFSTQTEGARNYMLSLHPFAVIFILALFFFASNLVGWPILVAHLVAFTLIAMTCHGQLSHVRPHPKHLTAFYLYLAIGGALGGILNAFIAPEIFTKLYEYPLVALLSLLLNPLLYKKTNEVRLTISFLGVVALMLVINFFIQDPSVTHKLLILFLLGSVCISAISICPSFAFIFGIATILLNIISNDEKNTVYAARNFFGPISVKEKQVPYQDQVYRYRSLNHGTTIHGIQIMDEEFKGRADLSYYTVLAPIFNNDDVININEVAVMGLGAGTLLCYNAPDRRFTAIEIDSEIVEVARRYFTFIDNCSPPENEIIVGDGRLVIDRLDRNYDLIVLDAFSSDSIPQHLLTQEALLIYKDKLTAEGIITINISNRYFDLSDVIAKTAESIGFDVYSLEDNLSERPPWEAESHWLALTKNKEVADLLVEQDWEQITAPVETRIWTDNYSYILSTLK
ncbi:MAG: spermidine synthase [Pseudomonadota bacterium]